MGLPARVPRELGEASHVGLQLGEGLSFGRWQELGKRLCEMERAIQWWIGDWWAFGRAAYGERAEAAAATGIFGYSFQSLMIYGSVCRAFPETFRRLKVPFAHHLEVAALRRKDQAQADALLDEAERDKLSVRELRHRVGEINRVVCLAKFEFGNVSLPTGRRYSVIYADPPWQYEGKLGSLYRTADNHYPTMPLDKIRALDLGEGRPVTDIIADNAMLYLWATAPKLAEAMQVITAWGFEYRTNIVWVKNRAGTGCHTRGQHEHLLIARRGKMPVPSPGTQPSSVIETDPLPGTQESSVIFADRREHSVKPERAYEIIEEFYANNVVRKIELFARGPARAGWDVWGNQAEQSAPHEQGTFQPSVVETSNPPMNQQAAS